MSLIKQPFGFGGAGGADLPPQGDSIQWHFRADLGITTSGNGVSVWLDQVGETESMSQTDDTDRPGYDATKTVGTKENAGIVIFDKTGGAAGYGEWMKGSNIQSTGQPFTVFCLGNPVSYVTNCYIWDGRGNGGTDASSVAGSCLEQTGGSPNMQMQALVGPISFPLGEFHLATTIWNGASSFFQIDDSTTDTGTVNSDYDAGMYFGTNQWQGGGTFPYPTDYEMVEWIGYDGALGAGTSPTLAEVQDYFKNRYGLWQKETTDVHIKS